MADPEEAAKPQLVELRRQTTPASSGKVMPLLAVGAVKPTVVVKLPTLDEIVVDPLPCRVKDWPTAPTVNAPPGVIFRAAALLIKGVVTLVVKVGLLLIVRAPRADRLRFPLALTATVPLASGRVIVLLEVVIVAVFNVLVNALPVPSLYTIWPKLPVLPTVNPAEP